MNQLRRHAVIWRGAPALRERLDAAKTEPGPGFQRDDIPVAERLTSDDFFIEDELGLGGGDVLDTTWLTALRQESDPEHADVDVAVGPSWTLFTTN